ncbi:hypothetical protein WISP_27595 [Willisornis vidua]|uniref:Uncharacterized protein n=1 Tax=Willisornis vidua TaxID=1566151 RepID=A0ABQ9DRT9_9PASS|nr:hypothetical protein WISP_27595 [Willisornis vidua]
MSSQMNSVSLSLSIVPSEEGKLEAENRRVTWKSSYNFSLPGRCPSRDGQAVMLQVVVRPEQRLGPPNAENQENSRGKEKKEAAPQENNSSSQQQRGAGENRFPPQQHTLRSLFSRTRSGKMSPKNKRDNLPPPKQSRRRQ